MLLRTSFLAALAISTVWLTGDCIAEVKAAAADGFQLEIRRTSELPAELVLGVLISDFSKWYDADHSYSGKPENLSIDLQRHCMYEVLPQGGFVRHMEVAFYQPGKLLRLTGGLGPLQGMGVDGALTFSVSTTDGRTNVKLSYNVSGFSGSQLDKLAPIVDQVLSGQMDRLKRHCDRVAQE